MDPFPINWVPLFTDLEVPGRFVASVGSNPAVEGDGRRLRARRATEVARAWSDQLPRPVKRNRNAAPVKFSDQLCLAELRAKHHFRPRMAPRAVLHQFATVPTLLATDNTCHRLTILYDSD